MPARADSGCIGFFLPIPSLLRPAPLRRRLWQGGGLAALLLLTFIVGNVLVAPDRAVSRRMLGHDFLAFYTAGTFAREGHFDLLYNLDAVRQFEHQTARENRLEIRESFGPFWNPPFYAWIFAPLSALPYRTALDIWLALNLAALSGAVVLLGRMLPGQPDWRTWTLVPLLVCISMPFLQALTHGQNTFISLFLLCCVVTAWRAQRDLLAGIVCGMMFYKPQLAAVLAAVLVLSRGWRAFLGLSFSLGSLVLLTGITMPNAIGTYLHQLPLNVHFMQVDNPYLWERHVTLKALWRLLIQGRSPGAPSFMVTALTLLTGAAIAAALLRVIWRERRAAADDIFTGETKFIRRDRLIAATVASMPLLMPFYFDYDLLLLSVPAVLLAGEMLMRAPGTGIERLDRLLLGAWAGMYAWTMVNPGLARMSGVNMTVVLLATVAALLLRRAGRTVEADGFNIRRPQIVRVTARRAA